MQQSDGHPVGAWVSLPGIGICGSWEAFSSLLACNGDGGLCVALGTCCSHQWWHRHVAGLRWTGVAHGGGSHIPPRPASAECRHPAPTPWLAEWGKTCPQKPPRGVFAKPKQGTSVLPQDTWTLQVMPPVATAKSSHRRARSCGGTRAATWLQLCQMRFISCKWDRSCSCIYAQSC